jgi:hypothetical protein
MRREVIRMEYLGSCISVNHYLGRRKDGGYYVKEDTRIWKTELGWLLKKLHLEDWQPPLEVTCSATFHSEHRACDLSNFSKIINDTIEDTTGINDKFIHWHDGTRTINPKEDPHLIITISEPSPDIPPDALESTRKPLRGKR